MLKLPHLLFILCLIASSVSYAQTGRHHNKIDDLHTAADVESLLRSIDSKYTSYSVHDTMRFPMGYYYKLYDSLHISRWTAGDLDQNGYNDLVVLTNKGSLYVMDHGDGKMEIIPLQFTLLGTVGLPRVVNEKKVDHVQYLALTNEQINIIAGRADTSATLITRDLVYRYGGWIEYVPIPQKVKIKKIILASTPTQLGEGYVLTLDSTQKASYISMGIRKKPDTTSLTIDHKQYKYIMQLADYICSTDAKSSYSTFADIHSAGHISITYESKKTHSEVTYGFSDTFGVGRLYTALMSLRENKKPLHTKRP